MIRWNLTDNEIAQLRNTLNCELERRQRWPDKGREIQWLISSLNKAVATIDADIVCYCDTNYEFSTQSMSISYRIGEDETIYREIQENMAPPPNEYLGIISVLQKLEKLEVTGRVLVITDASRCALALQMGLRYKVPKHTENQSPRAENFGHSYDAAIALTKTLLTKGCRVEYSYRNRGFINEILKLA